MRVACKRPGDRETGYTVRTASVHPGLPKPNTAVVNELTADDPRGNRDPQRSGHESSSAAPPGDTRATAADAVEGSFKTRGYFYIYIRDGDFFFSLRCFAGCFVVLTIRADAVRRAIRPDKTVATTRRGREESRRLRGATGSWRSRIKTTTVFFFKHKNLSDTAIKCGRCTCILCTYRTLTTCMRPSGISIKASPTARRSGIY